MQGKKVLHYVARVQCNNNVRTHCIADERAGLYIGSSTSIIRKTIINLNYIQIDYCNILFHTIL